jgi:hypothetical protein
MNLKKDDLIINEIKKKILDLVLFLEKRNIL